MIKKKLSLMCLLVTLMWLTNPGFSQEEEEQEPCRGFVPCETPSGGVVGLGCFGTIDCVASTSPSGSYVECDGIRWICPTVPD